MRGANEEDLERFGRGVFERAEAQALPGLCEGLAGALAEMRRRGRTEDEVIQALRGVGHDLWSFDEENSVWCGDWTAPAPGGVLIVEGVGESWCKVSWRVEWVDADSEVYSATFDAKSTG